MGRDVRLAAAARNAREGARGQVRQPGANARAEWWPCRRQDHAGARGRADRHRPTPGIGWQLMDDFEAVVMALSQMAAFRGADITAEAVGLFGKRLLSDGHQVADIVAACAVLERSEEHTSELQSREK